MTNLEEVGAEMVSDWPPLTDEQLSKLDAVLNLPVVEEAA